MSTNVRQLFDLEGKTALVTGGSRGLGLQIAESLGEAGARLLLTSRKAGDLDEAAAHLKARGIAVEWVAADASQPDEIRRVAAEAMQRLGQVDILVNNAGATWGAPAEEHPLEAWDKVMNLNVRSLFLMSQAIGKASMIPRRYGRIINVASIAGLSGSGPERKFIAYGTSKGAVVNFTRTLAAVGEDKLAAGAPLGRIGDDDDLKGAALLFASQAGKHITGQILAVDGGVSAIHGH